MQTNLFTLLVLALPALAQTTVKDALVKHWKTSAEFTMAVARAMSADAYNFRPVPQEMSFGQLMAHIGGINLYACANASGLARPGLAWAGARVGQGYGEGGGRQGHGHPVSERFVRFLCQGRRIHDARAAGLRGGPGRAPSDWLRMVMGVLHAHGASSSAGGSLPAREGHPAAGLHVLARASHRSRQAPARSSGSVHAPAASCDPAACR